MLPLYVATNGGGHLTEERPAAVAVETPPTPGKYPVADGLDNRQTRMKHRLLTR